MHEASIVGTVYVVDDDADLAASLSRLLRGEGYLVNACTSPAQLLREYRPDGANCVVTDVMMEGCDGFELAAALRGMDGAVAFVFMTGWPKTADAVDSLRLYGGVDYLEKPLDIDRLLAAVAEGLSWSGRHRAATSKLAGLTQREREVFTLLTHGLSNKQVAAALGIRPKTVEDHRASIMNKTQSASLAQLMELARPDEIVSIKARNGG